jgi:hypothetical protein
MPTPSLILVPARFKTGKLYTPVATTSGGLVLGASGDFNVTRATTATRVNASGFIESVASGIPRLDYYTSGGTAGCPALLVEPQAQNTCLQSETFQSWAFTNASGSSGNVGASPSNTQTAGLFIPNSGTTGRGQVACGTLSNATAYSFSWFIKAPTNSLTSVWLYVSDGGDGTGGNRWGVIVDLSNFTLTDYTAGNGSVTSKAVENYGNGWYRIRVTGQVTSGMVGSSVAVVRKLTAGADTNGINGVLVWGAQLEVGSIATSYIPTTTAAVTRNAEVISVTGAVSGCIGQTQGTLYAEFRYLGPPTLRAGFITLRNASFRGFSINAPSNLGIRFESRNNAGTSTVVLTNTLNIGDYYKIAIAYDTGGTAAGGTQASGVTAYVNGSPATVSVGDLRVPDTALNEVRLYGAVTSTETETPNGNLRSAAFYTTKLTNAELAALTTL